MTAMTMTLCGCERSEQLTEKYRYEEMTPAGTGIIVSGSELVVYPDIVEFDKVGKYVIGQRNLATNNMNPRDPRFTVGLGYFILDTSSGRLVQGLSKQQIDIFIDRL